MHKKNEDNNTFFLSFCSGGQNRVKVTMATLQQAVTEALEEQLEPLNTALRLIRLDAFTENIHRQVSFETGD